jgi:hypothetical protein
MNKTIIFVTLAAVGLIGLMWWGSIAQKAAKADTGVKSALTVSEKLYDFGTISMKNGNVTKEFVITNPGNKDIFVPSVVTSCMCTKAFTVQKNGTTKGPFGMPGMGFVPPANETVKAGESLTVRVVYDPNAHGPAGVGPVDRFVTITDASGSKLELEIKAQVTP